MKHKEGARFDRKIRQFKQNYYKDNYGKATNLSAQQSRKGRTLMKMSQKIKYKVQKL